MGLNGQQTKKQQISGVTEVIGVNGGTFDPIHFGHLRPALEVCEALGFSQVRFVPAYQPVHRQTPQVSAQQRLEMTQLALADQARFCVDAREIDRAGPSWMVDTLASLQREHPRAAFILIMGEDVFAHFDQWHDWSGILRLANIVVAQRPQACAAHTINQPLYQTYEVDCFTQPAGQVLRLPVTQLAISASDIRARRAQGLSIDYLLPTGVQAYIEAHHLYASRP